VDSFIFTGKRKYMSLVQSAPSQEDEEIAAIVRKNALKESLRPSVIRDFKIALRHAKNGVKRFTITPASKIVRINDPSSVHIDLQSSDCAEIKILKELYRENCPKGMSVEFSPAKALGSLRNDEQPEAHLLEVTILVPTKKKSRTTPWRSAA